MTDSADATSDSLPKYHPALTPMLKQAIENCDGEELAALLEPLTLSEALREFLELDQ